MTIGGLGDSFTASPAVISGKGQDKGTPTGREKRKELDTLRFSRSRDKRLPVRRAAALSFFVRGGACDPCKSTMRDSYAFDLAYCPGGVAA